MNDKSFVSIDELGSIIEERINNGQDVRITVSGQSMYPMLRNRIDSVILTKQTNLKKYDIPLYKRLNGQYVLHRIVKKNGSKLNIVGDNQNQIEYNVSIDSVVGVVKGFYRKEKYISCHNLLYKIYSFIWVLFLPIRHIIINGYLRIRLGLSKKNKERQDLHK